MIIENTGLNGLTVDLGHLDHAAEKVGFIRWQWDYYRATYDYKIEESGTGAEYYLRFNARVQTGKLENTESILSLEEVYIGKGTFPHGLDYSSPIPEAVKQTAAKRLAELKKELSE